MPTSRWRRDYKYWFDQTFDADKYYGTTLPNTLVGLRGDRVPFPSLGLATRSAAILEAFRYRGCIRRSPECQQVAFPATSLLDRQGRVRSRFLEEFYRETEYKRQSLLLLNPGNGPAPVAGTKISSEHLDLITCPTESGIAPGNRFELVFESSPALAFTFTHLERQDTAWFRQPSSRSRSCASFLSSIGRLKSTFSRPLGNGCRCTRGRSRGRGSDP